MAIVHSVEALAALTGVIFFNKFKDTNTKYFIYFLVYLTVCEFIGRYTKFVDTNRFLDFLIGTKFEKNHWFSTLYWVIGAIVFYAFYFYRILKTTIFKTIIKYLAYAYLLFSLVYIALNWELFFVQFFTVLDVLGALIIFMCCMFYFTEILFSDKLLTFYKSINFYISATIFIWWTIITSLSFYDGFYTYEVGKDFVDLEFVSLRKQIFLFANIFMYSTFTFALIYCKPVYDND